MSEQITRMILVDDQVLYRDGLGGLIEHWPEFKIVGEASNGKEAIDICMRTKPDLVLMDVQMPEMDGIEAARIILEKLPDVSIVMLTVENSNQYVFKALDLGIKGFLLKDTPARQLRVRLNNVVSGDSVISDGITSGLLEEFTRLRKAEGQSQAPNEENDGLPACELSERDKTILKLIAQGKSNEEISSELYLSLSTVKKRIAFILQTLYLENRVQLAVYATKHHFND